MRAIFTYHSVDDTGSVISIAPDEFAEHVRWLSGSDVDVVPVEKLLSLDDDHNAVALTFDDAFTNFASIAWPLLRDRGLPATLFVPTRHVGRSNQWDTTPGGSMPALPILDWESLGSLAAEGLELGAHSRSHADLRMLSDAQLTDEIEGSFEDIARETGTKASGFAYPYGRVDDRVTGIARAHCDWACTTELRPLSQKEDSHLLPRLDTYYMRGPARISEYGSPVFKSYISLRATVRRVRGR